MPVLNVSELNIVLGVLGPYTTTSLVPLGFHR
jgi:hypothetical protein